MKIINKKSLLPLLNSNIQSLLKEPSYPIKEMKGEDLLTSDRIDILAKYLYAKFRVEKNKSSFAKELYLEHIRVFNNFIESDDTGKIGEDDFLNSFDELIDSIYLDGFREDSVIPINQNNLILDGAHRSALAVLKKEKVNTVQIEYTNDKFQFNLDFFKKRGLSDVYLDALAVEYAILKKNTYMVIMWPKVNTDKGEYKKVLNKFGTIVYEKEIKFNYEGFVNFMTNVYYHEPWLGSIKDDFSGARSKASQCYNDKNNLRAILFEADEETDLEQLILMKDEVRKIYNVGKHAIHINDTYEETLEFSKLLFNDNGIAFLNAANSIHHSKFSFLLSEYINWIKNSKLGKENFAIIGGLSNIYGIRETEDLDFITSIETVPNEIGLNIEKEAKKINYCKQSIPDLIYHPANYFYFKSHKFTDLKIIAEIKTNRNNINDKNDVAIIQRILKEGRIKKSIKNTIRPLFTINFYKRMVKLFLLKIRFYVYLIIRKLK